MASAVSITREWYPKFSKFIKEIGQAPYIFSLVNKLIKIIWVQSISKEAYLPHLGGMLSKL